MSRVSRNLILQLMATKGWTLCSGDVKSAFLQAEETKVYNVFGQPTKYMRRRLAYMMGLQEDEVVQMVTPAFGDPQAPRQWCTDADNTMQKLNFMKHKL